jgi:hypothetical protein
MGLEAQAITWENGEIDYADKQTVEAVLQTLRKKDEQSLLFGLQLVEKLDPKVVVPYLPIGLLGHPSPLVRSRSLKLFAATTDADKLKEIARLLQDENGAVQAHKRSRSSALSARKMRSRLCALIWKVLIHEFSDRRSSVFYTMETRRSVKLLWPAFEK